MSGQLQCKQTGKRSKRKCVISAHRFQETVCYHILQAVRRIRSISDLACIHSIFSGQRFFPTSIEVWLLHAMHSAAV